MMSDFSPRRMFRLLKPFLNFVNVTNASKAASYVVRQRACRLSHVAPQRTLRFSHLECRCDILTRHHNHPFCMPANSDSFARLIRKIHATKACSTRIKAREVMAKLDGLLDDEKKTKQKQKKEKDKLGKKGMVQVWANMTVAELANVLKVDVDKVFEFMLYVKGAEFYDRPTSRIRHSRVIEEICKVGGYRWKIIKCKLSFENVLEVILLLRRVRRKHFEHARILDFIYCAYFVPIVLNN